MGSGFGMVWSVEERVGVWFVLWPLLLLLLLLVLLALVLLLVLLAVAMLFHHPLG